MARHTLQVGLNMEQDLHPLLDGVPQYPYLLDMELWENLTDQSLARNNS